MGSSRSPDAGRVVGVRDKVLGLRGGEGRIGNVGLDNN